MDIIRTMDGWILWRDIISPHALTTWFHHSFLFLDTNIQCICLTTQRSSSRVHSFPPSSTVCVRLPEEIGVDRVLWHHVTQRQRVEMCYEILKWHPIGSEIYHDVYIIICIYIHFNFIYLDHNTLFCTSKNYFLGKCWITIHLHFIKWIVLFVKQFIND